MAEHSAERNKIAMGRMLASEPQLVGIEPAGNVVPGMTPETILTSGAPLEWSDYSGGQRRAVLYGAVYEGLARDVDEAERLIHGGRIMVRSTQDHGCIGSVAGIFTASMPVLIVEDATHGHRAFCSLYEGPNRLKLNYGAYDEDVRRSLDWLRDTLSPILGAAIRQGGPLALKPLMARALRMGDELHSRNTAATILFTREINKAFLELYANGRKTDVLAAFDFLCANEYSFLRIGMAAAKVMADAAHGIEGSSVVTAMAINCRDMAIRVSGLGNAWFRGPHPSLEGRFFDGFSSEDTEWIGGESCVTETVGLGGFAQVCAPTLQAYQGGDYQGMMRTNEEMYRITLCEHEVFVLPPFGFRGAPTGIDVFKVVDTGITPAIDGGLAGKKGGQIGAGVLRPPLDCFVDAASALRREHER